jgi:hypothetical protein
MKQYSYYGKVTVYKNYNGSYELYTEHNGYLETQVYYGYTIKAALSNFKQYLKGI